MTSTTRLGYAISQWKPNFDDFTRRERHVRALKVIAACGFTGVELRAGTGRWDPLGRPASIAANYGTASAFMDLLRQIGIEAVCSWYFDPGEPIGEELSPGRSVLEAGDYDPAFPMKLVTKDLGLAVDLAREVGMPVELTALVEQIHRRARAVYGDDAGEISALRLYEDLAGLKLRLGPD